MNKQKIIKWISKHYFDIKYPNNNLIGFGFLIAVIVMMIVIRILFEAKEYSGAFEITVVGFIFIVFVGYVGLYLQKSEGFFQWIGCIASLSLIFMRTMFISFSLTFLIVLYLAYLVILLNTYKKKVRK